MLEETKKDFTLLRPVALEAAKAGESICWYADADVPNYFSVTPGGNIIAFFGSENLFDVSKFRMTPLTWVENKPVYVGDVLYSWVFNDTFEVTDFNRDDATLVAQTHGCEEIVTHISYCSWTKPKEKRTGWIDVYTNMRSGMRIYETEEEAISAGMSTAVDCIKVSWME